MEEIKITREKATETSKAVMSKALEVLKICDTPNEFVGWLSVEMKLAKLTTFDATFLAIQLGPEIFERFSPEDWE